MTVKRSRELTRLYVAAGLAVLIWIFFKAYKLISAQVETGIDAPSRWALLALGLANVLAIGILLFIVARSLAKLYFERRSGILGARIRTRLVLALFAVGILPSLMLYLVGRDFIAKNVERWFRPEVQEIIRDGRAVGEAFEAQARARLDGAALHFLELRAGDPDRLRAEAGLDLVAELDGKGAPRRLALGPGLRAPERLDLGVADQPEGRWMLRTAGPWVAGVFVGRGYLEAQGRLATRSAELGQIAHFREALTTLPQSTFLFLTLLTLFAAVWIGLTISNTISEPVRALAKAAQRIGTGDLDVLLPVHGEDELAFLSGAFNSMTADLRANRAALEAQAARIERQRAYLGQLLEALPVAVLSWGSDGSLRTCNPMARRWLGLEGLQLPHEDDGALLREPRLGGLPDLLDRAREAGRSLSEEFRIGGEGEGRPVRAVAAPLLEGGVLAVLEDLSLLANAEQRAAWQEVARRMAHEVKNPLTPIQLTAQRLIRRVAENRLDPDLVREGAETILAEVQGLARLVDSFTRFAKLPAPAFAPCDAGEVLRQVAAMYAPLHKEVAWGVDAPEGPVPARWDADMVKRALVNLVENALAAVQGMDQPAVRLACAVDGGDVLLSVEDEGEGVPEADRPRLFEPYFSTKRKGTGLGLAIVRKIAEEHGGSAAHEPLAGGSRFVLRLPAGNPGTAS
jgi:nitrogen fixation/metabolism regulation signal transduction histidine kinase